MRLSLITPFRAPFNLPKDWILAHNKKWIRLLGEAEQKLVALQVPQARLGNLGWGKSRDAIYTLGGPGWYFHDHYLLRIGSKEQDETLRFPENLADYVQNIKPIKARWECWLMDNTMAVLVLEVDFEDLKKFTRFVRDYEEQFVDFREQWPQETLSPGNPIRERIIEAIEWCHRHLIRQMLDTEKKSIREGEFFLDTDLSLAASRDDCLKKGSRRHQLFSEEHPIYEKCFCGLWTHSFYSFQKEEISQLDEDGRRVLSSLLSVEQLDRLQREQGASFGWGCSSRIMDENNLQSRIFPNQWLEAVCVLQYYYSCFDIADTKLPVYIARARTRSIKGKHYEVLDSARGIRSALRIIINDYNDLRARAASEAHEAMEAYHQSWRVPDLFANLSKKFDLLEELIAVSSDAINKRAESAIQTILFIITLLSLIGLTSSLHQYLVGSYEGRFADPLHKVALSLGKGDLVIYSVVTVLAMIVIYLVYKVRRR